MPQGKYKPSCGKMTYSSEQHAWEHVVYFKRKGYDWMRPYKCGCGKWHLTRKWFDGKVPLWVKEASAKPSKKDRRKQDKAKEQVLPLAEQKRIYKNLNKPWYIKLLRYFCA